MFVCKRLSLYLFTLHVYEIERKRDDKVKRRLQLIFPLSFLAEKKSLRVDDGACIQLMFILHACLELNGTSDPHVDLG